MIDATVWGLNPLGYHLTNAMLHGLNGYLLFLEERTWSQWPFQARARTFTTALRYDLTAISATDSLFAFNQRSRISWIDVSLPRSEPPFEGRWEDTMYLLMRPHDVGNPTVSFKAGGHYSEKDTFELRPDLTLLGGRIAPREVDGFVVYTKPLHEVARWPGAHRVKRLLLSPNRSEGKIELRFFGIARRLADEARIEH